MDRLLRTGLWWIPLLFALLVAGVGGYAYRTLADAMRSGLGEDLQTILDADVAALELWAKAQKAVARGEATEPAVREAAAELVEIARREPSPDAARAALLGTSARTRVRELLEHVLEEQGYESFALLAPDGLVLAALDEARVGRRISVDALRMEAALEGAAVLSRPMRGRPTEDGATGPVVLRVGAGVPGAEGGYAAVLGFAIPAEQFGDVLDVARTGESGETYAFDADGVMLSRSRFDDQLLEIGLLEPGQESILTIQIRDPGGDLTAGHTPSLPLRARPLTRMAAAAVSGEDGLDLDGYPDYRGVSVVGAWRWLPDFEIGVATELDVDEAFAGLTTVRRAFAALAGVFGIAAVSMLGYSVVLGRLQRRYDSARRLGSYRVVEKIGEGGMGKVYRAQHALLRRPTAVKLLESSRASPEAVKRFEREVQAAAGLTHPNTIAIYDYGRTPEGAFYYAMEYLEGITVEQLIRFDGPQPEVRVVHLVRQAAASLAEAHGGGLIHRDLKPSNLMLCSRGGLLDFVKVLDFGLVRAREEEIQLTSTQSLTGTPLYLSPEALEAPDTMDARSDVYQLGAILYALLVGRPVFQGESLVEILSQHLHSNPVPPSEALGRPLCPELEKLVLRCLAKDREERPADGAALGAALEACVLEGSWTQEDARIWWAHWAAAHPAGLAEGEGSGSSGTLPSGWQVDLGSRFRGSASRTRG